MYNNKKGKKMKKIFMTLAATAVALGINAQAYVGGGLGVANISVDNGYTKDDATSFKFVPEVGYSFNEEWAAGVAFGWEGATKGGMKTLSVNPYARYTFVKGNLVSVFVDGSVGYAHTYNSGADVDNISVGLKPGVAVNLGDHLSFVTHVGFIGYQHEKDNNTKMKQDGWGVDVDGRNIIFGLYYSF